MDISDVKQVYTAGSRYLLAVADGAMEFNFAFLGVP